MKAILLYIKFIFDAKYNAKLAKEEIFEHSDEDNYRLKQARLLKIGGTLK